MKKNQKIIRIQLNLNSNDEYFFWGIVSSEPDYKLSLAINRKFQISLKSTNPLNIISDSGSELSFSRFTDIAKSPELAFTLTANRSGNNFLVKKLLNVDYIFMIHDSEFENNPEHITSKLKEIDHVTAVFCLDVDSLKDKYLQYLIS
jgi:hypothetical protein